MSSSPISSPRLVSLLPGKSLLMLAAHAGDELAAAGGTLAQATALGCKVHVVVVNQTADVSQRAAIAAAAELAYEPPMFWQRKDGQLIEPLVEEIRHYMRLQEVDTVLAPSQWEADPLRRALAAAAFEAVRREGGACHLAQYALTHVLRPQYLIDLAGHAVAKQQALQRLGGLAAGASAGLMNELNHLHARSLGEVEVEAFEFAAASQLAAGTLSYFLSESRRVEGRAIEDTGFPLVSVLIRSMNRPLLRDALDSIAAQTWPNIEVVVVNAGAQSHRKLGDRCGAYPLRLVESGRALPRSEAANVALDAAAGDYLCFLDDDDWFLPDHVAKLATALTQQPTVPAAYSGVQMVDMDGGALHQTYDRPFSRVQLLAANYLPIHSILFRRNALQRGCRFDLDFDLYEDWDFWLQVAQGGDFLHRPGISAYYRVAADTGSGAHRSDERVQAARLQLFRKWVGRCEPRQLFDMLALAERVPYLEAQSHDFRKRVSERESELHEAKLKLNKVEAKLEQLAHKLRGAEAKVVQAQDHATNVERSRDILLGERDNLHRALQRQGEAFQLKVMQEHMLRGEVDGIRHQAAVLAEAVARFEQQSQHADHHLRQALVQQTELARNLHDRLAAVYRLRSWHLASRLRRIKARLTGAPLPAIEGLPVVAVPPVPESPQLSLPTPPAAPAPTVPSAPSVTLPPEFAEFHGCFAESPHLTDEFRNAMRAQIDQFKVRPQIGVRISVAGAKPLDLLQSIDSVRYQLYPAWELYLADLEAAPAEMVDLVERSAALDTRIRLIGSRWSRADYVFADLVLPVRPGQLVAELTTYRLAMYLTRHNDMRATETGATVVDYTQWLAGEQVVNGLSRTEMQSQLSQMAHKPLLSIVMPTYNSDRKWLAAAIESVLSQSYPHWELCICDDASTRAETLDTLRSYQQKYPDQIKVCFAPKNGHISRASNLALAQAAGEYIVLLDHDDELPVDALFWVAREINVHPDANVIYSDEDKINEAGVRSEPHFKPDWNYQLFLSQNIISHLGVYRTSLVRAVGGFREGYEGSQDYDLALRVIDHCDQRGIYHIPRVLYHWRTLPGSTSTSTGEKPYAQIAAMKAINDHLQRRGIQAEAGEAEETMGAYRVRYQLPENPPLVSILIPTRDKLGLLKACVDSVLQRTDYPAMEIIIVDNGSVEPATLSYLATIVRDERIKVIRDDDAFNFSRLNNVAARQAKGEFVCLMNNDIEVINAEWLSEVVSLALQPKVGIVGCRLWYPDGRLQHGGVVIGVGGVANHAHLFCRRGNPGYFNRAVVLQEFSAVTGACFLVRKSIYDAVGGLDEQLAVAFNDIDFCLRVQAAGYRNVWNPYAELYHHESVSRGVEDTPEKRKRFASEVEFMQKRWGDLLERDPAYNPNLTLRTTDFALSVPPRKLEVLPLAVVATQADEPLVVA